MEFVNATIEYWEFIRTLRNDKRVLDGFIQSTHITEEMQSEYMKKYLSCYYITLINDTPAGYVGVIDDDIRICTHPDYQGKGIGKFMLREIMKIFPSAYGRVKIDNEVSRKLFTSVGFREKFIIYEYNNEN